MWMQQIGAKIVWEYTQMGGENDPLETVQEI